MIRYGTASNGVQRIGCRPCGFSLLVAYSYSRTSTRKPHKYRLAAYLLGMGKSTREVESMIGLSKKTVNDIRKSVVSNAEIFCGCGQEAGHQGWCAFRYDRSPARQAFMTRWGRPPADIDIDLVNCLRAQGKPVREIAALLKVDRNTINRHLKLYRDTKRLLPWFCLGSFNTRTSIAIRRYRLMHEPVLSGESFTETMNELWKATRDAGCPKCGSVRKQSTSECRRCITLRLIIQRAEDEIRATIYSLIHAAQEPLREFVESLAERRGLSSAQRLNLLIRRVSGTRNIQTEG